MTIAVDLGRKATNQTNKKILANGIYFKSVFGRNMYDFLIQSLVASKYKYALMIKNNAKKKKREKNPVLSEMKLLYPTRTLKEFIKADVRMNVFIIKTLTFN